MTMVTVNIRYIALVRGNIRYGKTGGKKIFLMGSIH